MKFTKSGQWVGARALKFRSAKPIITNLTPVRPDSSNPPISARGFEIGVKNARGNWGEASWGAEKWAKVDVRKICLDIAQWSLNFPNDLPLVESVVDEISESSVHELIHRDGEIGHTRGSGFNPADFVNAVAEMGHPIHKKLLTLAGVHAKRNTVIVKHPVIVIDLPDDTPQPVGKVQPDTVTIGNLTLKVRHE